MFHTGALFLLSHVSLSGALFLLCHVSQNGALFLLSDVSQSGALFLLSHVSHWCPLSAEWCFMVVPSFCWVMLHTGSFFLLSHVLHWFPLSAEVWEISMWRCLLNYLIMYFTIVFIKISCCTNLLKSCCTNIWFERLWRAFGLVFYEMKSRVVNFRNNLDENVGRMKFIVVGCELLHCTLRTSQSFFSKVDRWIEKQKVLLWNWPIKGNDSCDDDRQW